MKTFLSLFLVASATSVPLLLDSSLKGLALLLVAGLMVFVLRQSSASLRHLLWTSALASLLLLPLLSLILPEWNILPTPRSAEPALVSILRNLEHVPSSAPVTFEELSFAPTADLSPALPEVKPVTTPESSPPLQLSFKDWCFAIWAFATLFFLSRLGLNTLLTGRRNKSPNNSSNQIQETVDQLTDEFGIRRTVRIQFGLSKSMPMTCGILRPQLRLPLEASTWEPSHLRTVLLHELAHVKRHDVLTQLLVKLTCAVYWFNPLVWIVSRRIELEREKACDDLVLAKGVQPADYAESLLQIISQTQPSLSNPAGLAMARPSTLETRMKAILAQHLDRRRLSKKACFLVTLLGITLVLPIAMLASAQAETKPPQPMSPETNLPQGGVTLELTIPASELQENENGSLSTPEIHVGTQLNSKEASEKPERVPEFAEYKAIQKRVSENVRQVAALRGLYTEEHPELKKVKEQIQRDEQLLKDIRFKQSALEAQVPDALLQTINPLIDSAGIGALLYNGPSGYPIVAMVFPENPAANVLKPGDQIHSFRNSNSEVWVPLQYLKVETIAKALHGPAGSPIFLTILRGKIGPFQVVLKRTKLSMPEQTSHLDETNPEAPSIATKEPQNISKDLKFADAEEVAIKLTEMKVFDAEITVDARTNRLIFRGDSKVIANLKRMATKLDQPQEPEIVHVLTHPLKHRKATEMAERLRLLDFASITITPNKETNGLFIQGTPTAVLALQKLLFELDVPRPKKVTTTQESPQEHLLRVEMELASIKVSGLGEQHPGTLAAKAQFHVLQKNPEIRNEDYYRLLNEKITSLQAQRAGLKETGLSRRHPETLRVQAQLDAAMKLKEDRQNFSAPVPQADSPEVNE